MLEKEDYLEKFKSLEEVDKKFFDEIQNSIFSSLCALPINKYNPSQGEGKLVLCGTFKNDSSVKVLFLGIAPSTRRFDKKLRAFFPGSLSENSSGAFFFRALIETNFIKDFDVYITNLLKCSTPYNSFPSDEEIKSEAPILRRELELVRPNYVVCFGEGVKRAFLNNFNFYIYTLSIKKVLTIKHPSYFFRRGDFVGLVRELLSLKEKILEGERK